MSAPPQPSSLSFLGCSRLDFRYCGRFAHLEELRSRACREHMHAPRHDAGPSGLMTRAQAGAVVAVKILVEQDEVAPMRVFLELLASPYTGRRPA